MAQSIPDLKSRSQSLVNDGFDKPDKDLRLETGTLLGDISSLPDDRDILERCLRPPQIHRVSEKPFANTVSGCQTIYSLGAHGRLISKNHAIIQKRSKLHPESIDRSDFSHLNFEISRNQISYATPPFDPGSQRSHRRLEDDAFPHNQDPFAMLNQVFDRQTLQSLSEPLPPKYKGEKSQKSAVNSLDTASMQSLRVPSTYAPSTYSLQSQSLPDQLVPAIIRPRHDRDLYYEKRQHPDGSVFLVNVSAPPAITALRRNDPPKSTVPLPETESTLEQEADEDQKHDETKAEYLTRLTYWIEQMMFVSGETAEPSPETTWMIEEIVREQVLEMLKEATLLANRRGSKSISIVDLIFQIRHNPAKVSRLKTFLSWKDVRKNVKDSDDKAGGADADALDLEDGALPGANPSAPQKTSTNKKAKLVLPWEVQSYYSETVPEREDEEDEEEEEQNEATLARLASADERTKNMTKDEYVYWSDCRQASFTFRKGKRFREWAGFGTIIDSKPNDDVVDILGFLTFEIVQTLTEEALKVKFAEDLANKKANGLRGDNEASKKRKREGCTLFEMPEEGRTPVEPRHVREAFRRLQIVPTKYKFMRQGYAGVRTPLRMI